MNKYDLSRNYKLVLWQEGTIQVIRLCDLKVIYSKKYVEGENLEENLGEAFYYWLGCSTGVGHYDDEIIS